MSVFKRISEDEREKAMEQMKSGGGASSGSWTDTIINPEHSISTFTPKKGTNKVRFLPPLAGDEFVQTGGLGLWWFRINNTTYNSPKSFNARAECPLMDRYSKYRNVDEERAQLFKPSRRVGCYILDLNEEEEKGPEMKFWFAPVTLIENIFKRCRVRSTGAIIPVDDPELGRAVYFDREGENRLTRYTNEEVDQQPYPITDAMAEGMVPYKDLLRILSVEELEEVAANAEKAFVASPNPNEDVPEPTQAPWMDPSQDAEATSSDQLSAKIAAKVGSAKTAAA